MAIIFINTITYQYRKTKIAPRINASSYIKFKNENNMLIIRVFFYMIF